LEKSKSNKEKNMTLRQTLKKAQKQGWAIGHFNFSTLEQLKGIVGAAVRSSSPIILATSQGEAGFLGLEEAVALVKCLRKKTNHSLFLHLDHAKDLVYIRKAIELGYDSVHFDGSFLPFSENIKETRKVVVYAHKKGVLVEGELGYLRGESSFVKKRTPKIRKEDLTRPEQVEEFAARTKVDSLAIAIGNIHGIYRAKPKIDFKRLAEIRQRTDIFLVLHGSSGTSEQDLKRIIKNGVSKINVNTELRIVWRSELEKSFEKSPKVVKPYLILPPVVKATSLKIEKYIKLFRGDKK